MLHDSQPQPSSEESSSSEWTRDALIERYDFLNAQREVIVQLEREYVVAALEGDADAIETLLAIRCDRLTYRGQIDILLDCVVKYGRRPRVKKKCGS